MNTTITKHKIAPKITVDILLVLGFLVPTMILYLNYSLRGFMFTWPIFICWFMFVFIKNKNLKAFGIVLKKRKLDFFFMFSFILVVAINYFFVDKNAKSHTYLFTFINFFLILIVDSYYATKPLVYKYSILFYIVIALGIQALISIPYMLSAKILITRMLSSGRLSGAELVEAMKNGLGNNGLYSSIGATALIGIAIIKEFKTVYKLALILSVSFIIISIIISTFFASILLLVIGVIIVSFRYHKKIINVKSLVVLLIIVAGVFYFNNVFLSESKVDLIRPIENKLERFMSDEDDTTGRGKLANTSINTFIKNPFFGIGVPKWQSYHLVGEHMPWIDFLANFGFLGMLPFLIFLTILIRRNLFFYIKKDSFTLYRMSCLAGVCIFILANFISPIITTPNMYMIFLLYYTSYSNKKII